MDNTPLIEPIYLTSSYQWSCTGITPKYSYTRINHPNQRVLCEKIKKLYGVGKVMLFPSGIAAISMTFLAYKNTQFIVSDELYCDTFRSLKSLGINYKTFKANNNQDLLDTVNKYKNQDLTIFMESVSNPNGHMIDPKVLLDIKKQNNNHTIIIDNSWLSPIIYNPFKRYCDIVIESITKYISGGTILMGHVAGTKRKMKSIIVCGTIFGQHVSPYDCFSVSQSIDTLELRMNSISNKVDDILVILKNNNNVTYIMYPFIKSHPSYEIAKRELKGNPGIITFKTNIKYEEILSRFENLKDIVLATSYGKSNTLIDPYRLESDKENCLIRLAIGWKSDTQDILDDLCHLLQ